MRGRSAQATARRALKYAPARFLPCTTRPETRTKATHPQSTAPNSWKTGVRTHCSACGQAFGLRSHDKHACNPAPLSSVHDRALAILPHCTFGTWVLRLSMCTHTAHEHTHASPRVQVACSCQAILRVTSTRRCAQASATDVRARGTAAWSSSQHRAPLSCSTRRFAVRRPEYEWSAVRPEWTPPAVPSPWPRCARCDRRASWVRLRVLHLLQRASCLWA
jgi:hypothetical protein